jgi:hypothetical protein
MALFFPKMENILNKVKRGNERKKRRGEVKKDTVTK